MQDIKGHEALLELLTKMIEEKEEPVFSRLREAILESEAELGPAAEPTFARLKEVCSDM